MMSTSTKRAYPKVVIASGSAFFRNGGCVWLPPIEWESLKPWWEFLDEVILLKPEVELEEPPDGWMTTSRLTPF